MYWLLFIGVMIASFIVQQSLNHKFEKYGKVPLGLTGKEVAERMLRENGITDVQVVSVSGTLTDHYNPENKTINLSRDVYSRASVAAAAVAAHETGHAVQHARAYGALQLRSALVPVVSFANKWMTWIILIGLLLINSTPIPLEIGIGLFALTTLFAFVTLPVEVDASRRAVEWLRETRITDGETTKMASDALHAAAHTYVVAAISSLATLLYYIAISRR